MLRPGMYTPVFSSKIPLLDNMHAHLILFHIEAYTYNLQIHLWIYTPINLPIHNCLRPFNYNQIICSVPEIQGKTANISLCNWGLPAVSILWWLPQPSFDLCIVMTVILLYMSLSLSLSLSLYLSISVIVCVWREATAWSKSLNSLVCLVAPCILH